MDGFIMKNRKFLKRLEKEIACYAAENSDRDIQGFISRVFAYIRKNLHLLEDENYNRLYKECLLLLKWLNRKFLKRKNQNTDETFETVIDIMNTHEEYPFGEEIVSQYLQFRLDIWKTGYYDKLKPLV